VVLDQLLQHADPHLEEPLLRRAARTTGERDASGAVLFVALGERLAAIFFGGGDQRGIEDLFLDRHVGEQRRLELAKVALPTGSGRGLLQLIEQGHCLFVLLFQELDGVHGLIPSA
jgi:hypothetical protein